MRVGFKVDGATKFSHVSVKIESSLPDSISVVTTNKRNLNLNPADAKNPVIHYVPNDREQTGESSDITDIEHLAAP